MNIPIQQEEENYTAHIETRVHAGVVVHKLSFLTEREQMDMGLITEDTLEELESKSDAEECRLADEAIQDGYDG